MIHDVGDDVSFVVHAQAYPDISLIEMFWYKDDVLLTMHNSSHYQMEWYSIDSSTRILFHIINAQPKDSGLYTLVGNSSTTTTNISLSVYIKGNPEVVVDSTEEFYILNRTYELVCQSYSFPKSEVWWQWIPCSGLTNNYKNCFDLDSSSLANKWVNLTSIDTEQKQNRLNSTNTFSTTSSHSNLKPYLNDTRLMITNSSHSGHYRCLSKNFYGIGIKRIPFIVMGKVLFDFLV